MFQQNLINISGQTYRRGNQIGSGGYAVIYQGENIHNQEKVAIRVANDMTEDEYNIHLILIQQKKKFLIDVKGLEFNENTGTIVIAMELGKEDFHSFMDKNEYKQLENLDKNLVFHQMVSAVHELHELQYFHRDLKPENFIIIENFNKNRPRIKLIDYGLCKKMQNQNRFTQDVGTILFMAPEVKSSDQYDKSSDIWALGCIYYEIMTTQAFIQGTTYQELNGFLQTIQQNQIDQKIEQIIQMNSVEKNLLKGMLQKEPSQRLTIKEILYRLDNLTKNNFQPIQSGNSFMNFPNPIQPQQFQQWSTLKQQQVSAVRLQTQIINVLDQKYEKQLQEDIAQFKKMIDEELQEQLLKKKKEIEQQNLQEQRRVEEEIKQDYDQKRQIYLQDQEKLKQVQIAYEIETQNRLNQIQIQQKEELQKNLEMFKQQIIKDQEAELQEKTKQKKARIQAQIESEQKKIFEEKLKELNKKENGKKQQEFETKKKGVVHLVTCYIELLQKHQNIMIEKQKILKTFQQQYLQQVSLINEKVNNFLNIFGLNLSKANQVMQDLQCMNDYNQSNLLSELENEYQEKVTQQTTNSFQNIYQINQEIQNLNQSNQQIIPYKQIQDQESLFKRLQEIRTTRELKLNQQQDQLSKMKQLANVILQGSFEYEIDQLIHSSKKEIDAINQLEFRFNLIKNQYEQIKYLDLFKQEESLYELSQQCEEIEKQSQKIKENLNTIDQEFKKNEQIQIQCLNNLLIEVENQFDFLQQKYNLLRKEFQNIQVKQINDCENILYEIQNLIKKIYFQKQQFCIKKQKYTFGLIKQKFEEFDICYEQPIRQAEQLREANKQKQFSNDLLKKLQNLKGNLEQQIETFQLKSQTLRVNQEIQLQLQQQLDILRLNFKNYVQKCQGFENLINVNILDQQLKELKQSINEQEQFYQEFDLKFQILFQQAQTICQKIERSQQLKNEKWSQYNDLCQKVHQFQQYQKECRLPKDIIFCEYLCKIQKFRELLRKYEEHFDKCIQHYLQNEKIGKELQVAQKQNLDQFNEAKEQNLKYIHQIRENAQSNFKKLTQFLNSIFNVYKEQINFVKDSSYYESIYYSYKSYEQLMLQVDSLNSEIQNYYSQENLYDNAIFFNDKIKAINNYIIQLENIKQSINQFDEVEFQKDRKCFIRLVSFLIVSQLYILNEIIQRQLRHEEQQKVKQIENKSQLRYFKQIKSQKQEEFQIKMINYQNDQTKFQQFLSLNELQFTNEYLKLIENNEEEIEKLQTNFFINDRVTLRGQIKDQDIIKQVLEYCRTIEYSKLTQSQIIQRIIPGSEKVETKQMN